MDIEALVEAERRGILPESKKPLLDEARRRGLVPSPEGGDVRNPDGTYGQPPEGMVANPYTGQMTERDLLANRQRMEGGTGQVDSFIRGAARGVSFGGIDEAVGGINAVIPGPGTMGERYAFGRENIRAQEDVAKEENPGTFLAGEITGAALPAVATAPLATSATMAGTMVRGAALGGAEGSLYGFLQGEGGVENRGAAAGRYGITGAGVGAAAPPVMRGAQKAASAVYDPISAALNMGNRGRAQKAIGATVRASGKSPDDIANAVSRAAQEGQPEFRVMDALGIPGQRQASGIARSEGDAAAEIAEFLTQRQADQGPRVARFADEAFEMRGRTANQVAEGLKTARGQAADVAYDAARGNASPVDVRGALAVIDDRLGPMSGSGVADDAIGGKLAKFRNRLAAQSPDNTRLAPADSVELSDFDRVLNVKRDIQDEIGAAVRAGRNNEARELGKLSKSLDEALEAASPQYRAANDKFSEASRVIDALGEGQQMARPSTRATDNVQRFGQMTPEQQSSARVGYGDEVLTRLERNKSPTSNRAKEVYGSTKARTEADAMTTDPRLFADRMARESQMWETQNRALGGSRTADNLADQQQVTQAATGAGRALRSLANLQFGDALANAGQALSPVLQGQNEGTRKLIAQALMSDDPMQALSKAAISDQKRESLKLILESLTRSGTVRASAQ